MFNLEEFKDNAILESIVGKLNKYLSKNKVEKVPKLVEELEGLLNEDSLILPVTYILSVLAEENFKFISKDIIEKVQGFLKSHELKLKLNAVIILGFAMIKNPEYIDNYLIDFILALQDKNLDIKENAYYFLQEIIKIKPKILCTYKEYILRALFEEQNENNLYSLLEFLTKCDNFYFNEMFWFRKELDKISALYSGKKEPIFHNVLVKLCKKLYGFHNIDDLSINNIYELINNQLIIKKFNFTDLSKQKNIQLKDFMEKVKDSRFGKEEIYFYTKNNKSNEIYFYEVEKEKLINFFEQYKRIPIRTIKNFLTIIESELELKYIVKTLIKLKHINGYFSKLGYFYPYSYLKNEFEKSIKNQGIISLEQFNYLPLGLIKKIIKHISDSTNQKLLLSKNNTAFYSLKTINQEINFKAAKDSIVDIKPYRELLTEKSFIKLIKNLPKEYLTNYRKGTVLLTNLGLMKVKNEIENSKILGYLSIPKISEKLGINKILLVDVLDHYIDPRSGIFNKEKNIFYYSKFLNDKIEKINRLSDNKEKENQILQLTKELKIQKDLILAKIDENLKLIGEDIKQQDKLVITKYLEKTGMNEGEFFKFIEDLGLKYLKKGDVLIFNEHKIKEAEKEIKSILLNKSKTQDHILLGGFDITSSLVESLLKEMQNDEKIIGIFYKDDVEKKFYTQKGIEKLLLQNSSMFSFHDLFYGKELLEQEIELLRSILENMLNKRILKGNFDEESLTFSSFEVIFAQDYNSMLREFEKTVNSYITIFNSEFHKIRKILTKSNENIFPQEIKEIQASIDRINDQYIRWRSGLEAFIRKVNIQLLKKQGYTMKKYKMMISSTDKKEDIKLFEDDPEVQEKLNEFNSWIKLFNDIELKYGNIIFYQKRLINNPDNKKNKKRLESLLEQLELL
ncbi:MAG: hypothetical protein ACFE8M_00125 [Candidatus Hermodarchaeota archaeon]